MVKGVVVLLAGVIAASGAELRRPVAGEAQGDNGITPQLLALGDSVFHGKAGGGICFTCHGPTAKGVKGLAPDLTDKKWLHGDGSLAFIQGIVEKGVPKPKESAAPMLPKGGVPLNAMQVKAVAAYVYSLSPK